MSATLAGIRLRETAHRRRELRRDPDADHGAAAALTRDPAACRRSAGAGRRLRPPPAVALRHLRRPADRARLGRRRPGLRPAALAGAGAAPVVLGRRRLRPGGRQRRAGVVPDGAAARDRRRCASAHVAAMQRPARRRRDRLLHLLRADDLSRRRAARPCTPWRGCACNADGRPLAHHVQELVELHDARARGRGRRCRPRRCRPASAPRSLPRAPPGEFAADQRRVPLRRRGACVRPARPWINVLANPGFGAQISEAGGGYSWAVNSRLQPAHAVVERPGRRPARRMVPAAGPRGRCEVWSVAPSAAPATPQAEYRVAHGQGYSTIGHRRGELDVSASWCVDPRRRGQAGAAAPRSTAATGPCNLRVVGIAEWILGAQPRRPRHAVTAREPARRARPRPPTQRPRRRMTALLLHAARSRRRLRRRHRLPRPRPATRDDRTDWTCDRRELFDARGRLVAARPASARRSGGGLDPCAALAARITPARRRDASNASSCSATAPSPDGAQRAGRKRGAGRRR